MYKILISSIIFTVLFFCHSCNQSIDSNEKYDMNATEQVVVLNFEVASSSFYLKTRVWGITSNHEEIFLTKNKSNSVSEKTTDYIFYCSEIFYKQVNDTLIIYAPKGLISEPIERFSEIMVVINELANYDEIKDYNRNYKKYGLNKLSVSE